MKPQNKEDLEKRIILSDLSSHQPESKDSDNEFLSNEDDVFNRLDLTEETDSLNETQNDE